MKSPFIRNGDFPRLSDVSDGFDFNQTIFRKSGDLYGRSGRVIAFKISSVDFVYNLKIIHVLKKTSSLYYLVKAASRFFQYGFEVSEYLSCLFFNARLLPALPFQVSMGSAPM